MVRCARRLGQANICWPGFSLLELVLVAAIVAVILAVVAIILVRRRVPALPAAAFIYLVTVSPVLGFAQAGPQFVADKYSIW